MSTSTSTLVSRTNSSDATSTMPRSPAWGFIGGALSRIGTPLEAARRERRPDTVDERRPARITEPRGHDRHHLLHGHHVQRIARPGAVLHVVPDAEAVHVVGGDLRGRPVLVA